MLKFFFLGRRAPGLTRRAAQAHLRDVHGRMVVLPPADAGAMPAYYAQNHVVDGGYPATDGPHAIERDLVTELHFESMADMQAAIATPYYLENLRPDEPRFVHDPSVVRLNVAPRVRLAGPKLPARLFVLVSRTPGIGDDRWQAVCDGIATSLATVQGLVALTENTVLSPPQGARFVDSVFEGWFVDQADAMAGAARARDLFDVAGVARDRSLVIVAEEFTQERLRALLG